MSVSPRLCEGIRRIAKPLHLEEPLRRAYEPLPDFAVRLAAEFPGVDVRQVALSNEAGGVDFHVVVDDPMQSGMKARGDSQRKRVVRVGVDTLDRGLPDGFVPNLIKIDDEGAEQQVLEGAIGTLTKHQPVVVVEHRAGLEDQYGTSPGRVYDLLVEEPGVRIFDINRAGPYSRAQFEGVYHDPIWNFVAHR